MSALGLSVTQRLAQQKTGLQCYVKQVESSPPALLGVAVVIIIKDLKTLTIPGIVHAMHHCCCSTVYLAGVAGVLPGDSHMLESQLLH